MARLLRDWTWNLSVLNHHNYNPTHLHPTTNEKFSKLSLTNTLDPVWLATGYSTFFHFISICYSFFVESHNVIIWNNINMTKSVKFFSWMFLKDILQHIIDIYSTWHIMEEFTSESCHILLFIFLYSNQVMFSFLFKGGLSSVYFRYVSFSIKMLYTSFCDVFFFSLSLF